MLVLLPFDEGTNRKRILTNYEYGDDVAHIFIDGKRHKLVKLGSKPEPGKAIYRFVKEGYKLSITSKEINSGRYSADNSSIVEVQSGEKQAEFKVYGQCGC